MSGAAVLSITPEAVWLQPGERIRTQCAVQADRNLPAEAKVWFWTLLTHCLRSTKWPASAEAIGDECGLSRRASYRHQRLLIDAGYIERDGQMLSIVPDSCRGWQSHQRDSASATSGTPVVPPVALRPVGLAPMDNGKSHAPARKQEKLQEKKTTTPAPQNPEAGPVVLSPEAKAIADALIERGVWPKKKAEALAQVDDAGQSFAVAQDIERRTRVENPAGLYVAAIQNRWKTKATADRKSVV